MSDKTAYAVTRRRFMGTALGGAAILAAGPSFSAGKVLNILSHKVHQTVLGTGDTDLLKDWKASTGADPTFTTFDSNPLQDRLFREASLSETEYGIGYMVDNRPTKEIAALFEPLDAMLKADAIEDFADIAPGLVQGMTVDGKLIASRCAMPRRACSTTRCCSRRPASRLRRQRLKNWSNRPKRSPSRRRPAPRWSG